MVRTTAVAVLVSASHAVLFRPSTTSPLLFPIRERRSSRAAGQTRRSADPVLAERAFGRSASAWPRVLWVWSAVCPRVIGFGFTAGR